MSSQVEGPERYRRPPQSQVRDDLLTAARRVMAERGYDATSLDQIATAAGYSKGAVYSNFANKAALFLAALDDEIQTRIETVRSEVAKFSAGDLEPTELVARVGHLLNAMSADEPAWQMLFIDFWRLAVRDPEIGPAYTVHRRAMREAIADAIRSAHQDGHRYSSHLDADQLATLVLALSNGLAIERLADPDAVPDSLLGDVLGSVLDIAREP